MKTGAEFLAANSPSIRELREYIDPEVLALATRGEQWTPEEIERMKAITRDFFRKPDPL